MTEYINNIDLNNKQLCVVLTCVVLLNLSKTI